MISSFSISSSNFLGPVRNAPSDVLWHRLCLVTKIFCASSIVLNWCSYTATFSDHAVSLSFSSFASLHPAGCDAIAVSFDDLGASLGQRLLLRLLSRWPRPLPAHSPARHACRLQHGDRQSTPPSLGTFPSRSAESASQVRAATSRAKPPIGLEWAKSDWLSGGVCNFTPMSGLCSTQDQQSE